MKPNFANPSFCYNAVTLLDPGKTSTPFNAIKVEVNLFKGLPNSKFNRVKRGVRDIQRFIIYSVPLANFW